jgi:hypothetical protein
MAVQIPRITAENAQPVQAPRITAQPIDAVSPMAKTEAALQGAGKEIVRYRDQIMYQEADNIATKADNDWQDWRNKEIHGDPATGKVGLMFQEGDPKKLYADYNERAAKKLEELSKPPEGQSYSELTQNILNRRLNKRDQEFRNEEDTLYGHQKYNWDKSNTEANVKFAQQGMPGASTLVEPGDLKSFAPLAGKIQDISAPIVSNALQYGGAVKNDDGSVVITPAIKQQISKAVSEGLFKTIDNLYNSDTGDGVAIKKAEAIREQFADQLDPLHKDTIAEKSQKAEKKQQATQLASKLITNPNAVVDADVPFDVKKDAVTMANEYRRGMDQMNQAKQKDNYEQASKYVDNVMQSGHPFPGILAMKSDPKVALFWDNMGTKQQQALEHMVDQPKQGSEPALNKMVDLFLGKGDESVRGMSQETFALYKSGLTKQQQNKYQSMFEKANIPNNAALETQTRLFGQELDRQAVGAGLLHKVPGSNLFTYKDQAKEPQLRKELLDSIADQPIMSPKERSDYVAKFIADKKAGSAFEPPDRKTIKSTHGSAGTPPPAPSPSPTPSTVTSNTSASKTYGNLTQAAQMQWVQLYKKKNNGMVPSTPQLLDFIDKETK